MPFNENNIKPTKEICGFWPTEYFSEPWVLYTKTKRATNYVMVTSADIIGQQTVIQYPTKNGKKVDDWTYTFRDVGGLKIG